MGQNSITMFSNDSGVGGGPIAYVQDAFPDISDTPTNNSGWSSTISSNPMNNLYGDDDFPRYGPKTLWIKDLVLESNRDLWINGKPTYRVIWNEPFPSAQGYVFGNVQLVKSADQTYVKIQTGSDGFGVGGVFARAMFLMIGNTAAAGAASGTVLVDGNTNATVVDWSNLSASNPVKTPLYAAIAHASTNEAYNIHDFRLISNQSGGIFTIAGVIVYSENSTLAIDQFPGVTYNNKTKATTTSNNTLALPIPGTSLGGKSTIWKNSSGGYSMSTIDVSTILSAATGASGTNILNVTAGQGASFSAGYGIVSSFGTSTYVGVIQSISTDALTVYPTLPFGISSSIYRYFQSGQSLSVNASLNILAYTFGSTELIRTGMSMTYLDPLQNFAVWGTNLCQTLISGSLNSLAFLSPSGFVQCEGYFSAAEIEWVGMSFSVLSGTMVINGLPVYNHNNIGFTGLLKKSVFTDAGPGWNNFSFFPGSSHVNVAINRINLYNRNKDLSASYGLLASFDTLQSYVPRATNATCIAPGTFKRTFSDQLPFKGLWTRSTGGTQCGAVMYTGSTTTGSLQFQYYGTHFAILGLGTKASMNISIDGVSTATVFNRVINTATLGFHTIGMSLLGGTNIISAIDFFRPTGEMKNLQTFSGFRSPPMSSPQRNEVRLDTANGYGAVGTHIRTWATVTANYGSALTINQDANNGDSVTVNADGRYAITYVDNVNADSTAGISIDSTSLTSNPNSIPLEQILALVSQPTAGDYLLVNTQAWIRAGSILRAQSNGDAVQNSTGTMFRVLKLD